MTSPVHSDDATMRSPKMPNMEVLQASLYTGERADTADLSRQLLKEMQHSDQVGKAGRAQSLPEVEQRVEQNPDLQWSRRLREAGGFRRGFLAQRRESDPSSNGGGDNGPGAEGAGGAPTLLSQLVPLLKESMDYARIHDRAFGEEEEQDEDDIPESAAVAARPVAKLSNKGVAVTVFKGNCGMAILFGPHAWRLSGYLLSTGLLMTVLFTILMSNKRLITCRQRFDGSYGQLMYRAAGPAGRLFVDASVVMMEFGWVCSLFISSATLIQSTLFPNQTLTVLIIGEAVLVMPFVAIRKVSSLWPLNFLGTALVLLGLLCTFVALLASMPHAKLDEMQAANTDGIFVFLGIGCFMFEGTALLLPLYDSSEHPENFIMVSGCVLTFIMLLSASVATLGYAAYGAGVESLVLLSMPPGAYLTVIRLGFAIAMLCTIPYGLLPGVRVVENLFFLAPGSPGRTPPTFKRKLCKSFFRFVCLGLCAAIGIAGSSSVSNFVSLVGAVCGLPLAFICPAICHWFLGGEQASRWFNRLIDGTLVVVGLFCTVSIAYMNIVTWGQN